MADANGLPARGYTWPPFEAGHEVNLRHGIWTPKRVEPVAARYVQVRLQDASTPWVAEPRFRAALWACARAEARVELLTAWVDRLIDEKGVGAAAESGQGRTSPLALLERWETRAERARSRLGLDPISAAKFAQHTAAARVDMARLLSDAREAAEARERGGQR